MVTVKHIQKLKYFETNTALEVDISDIEKGLYFLNVDLGGQVFKTQVSKQ